MHDHSFEQHLPGDDVDLRRAIACRACAKAKTKCDKLTPSCSRCILKGLQCEPRKTKRPTDTAERQARRVISMQQGPVKIAAAFGPPGPLGFDASIDDRKAFQDQRSRRNTSTSSSMAQQKLAVSFGYTVPSPAISNDDGALSPQSISTPLLQQVYTPPAERAYPTPYMPGYSNPYSTYEATPRSYNTADQTTTHFSMPAGTSTSSWPGLVDPVCIESEYSPYAGAVFFPESTLAPDLLSTVVYSQNTAPWTEQPTPSSQYTSATRYTTTTSQYPSATAPWPAFYDQCRATDFMNQYSTY